MRVVVYGAGAVGSVLGGVLSLHKHDVLLVGRRRLVDAVNEDGLRIKSATGEYVAHPSVAESLSAAELGEAACVVLTVKSYDTKSAMEALARVVPDSTSVVSFQNGVSNEDVIAGRFPRVYGGVCRMTCSMLQPGHVSFQQLGRVILGAHPKGSDPFARDLGAAFSEAGFDVCVSRAIAGDKWLKLAVNTQSVFNATIDPRDHDANEFYELKAALLEETRRVLKAAKIPCKSSDKKDPSIEEMIADLRRPRARRVDHGVKVHNSTWQDLYLKRDRIEAEYFHKPLIALGRKHGVLTPYNDVALEIAERCHQSGAGPESVRLDEVLAIVTRRSESS